MEEYDIYGRIECFHDVSRHMSQEPYITSKEGQMRQPSQLQSSVVCERGPVHPSDQSWAVAESCEQQQQQTSNMALETHRSTMYYSCEYLSLQNLGTSCTTACGSYDIKHKLQT